MKKLLGLYLAATITVGTALPQNAPGAAEPTLQAGVKQFGDGDLAGAVFTLEAVIRTLAVAPALHAKELSQAYLYRGAAFVGLSQEENAKGSFGAALKYDKDLRIGEEKFSPRVVRVFEAARTGKTKSVLLPPSNVAKKAGISGLGIAGIIAGVAAVGGGVAAATRGSSNPPPTPPTPNPSMIVTPTSKSGPGEITWVNSDPPPGSTISGCGSNTDGCLGRLKIVINIRPDVAIRNGYPSFQLKPLSISVCQHSLPCSSPTFDLAAGQTFAVQVSCPYSYSPSPCPTPLSIDSIDAAVVVDKAASQYFYQAWKVTYTFLP
jgi:hypothetical protein